MDMISTIMSGKGKSRYCRSFWQKKRSVIMEGIKAENCEKGKMSWFLWDDVNLKTKQTTKHMQKAVWMQSSLIRKYSNTIRAPAICQAISKSPPCALICLFLAIILKRWGSLSLSPFHRCGNQVTEWLSNWPKVTQLEKGLLSPFPTNKWTPLNVYWGTVLSSIYPAVSM